MSRNAIAVVSTVILCLDAGGGVSHSEAAVDKAEYELQERCGRRAAEMFEKQYGTGFVVTDIGGYRRTTYSSNYNATFNKCYMSLHTTTHGKEKPGSTPPTYDVTTLALQDVNANKQIGFCIYLNGMPPAPGSCYFEGHAIESADEWETLEKPYME
jgi:hypothetical protein